MRERLFVVDVDMTIYDCFAEPRALMPGAELLLKFLHASGELHLWSAAGAEHCKDVANEYQLAEYIDGYHDKPPYPVVEKPAIAILGRRADLQIDDDRSEQIPGWPFLWADQAFRKYGRY